MAGGMGGMANMQQMMKKVQKMQKEMEAAQKELDATEFKGSEPSGMIEVTITGEKKVKAISIKPQAVDPDDIDMLQDLLIEAINNAITTVEKETENTLSKYTNGMPGF